MTVNILGTTYEIVKDMYAANKKFNEDGFSGYVEYCLKKIVYCDMTTYKGYEDCDKVSLSEVEKRTLRHEIVHAFLFESGLNDNSESANAWAINEEMVDWFAINGLKIYKAWQETGCI